VAGDRERGNGQHRCDDAESDEKTETTTHVTIDLLGRGYGP
jgi:hypothetical protein